MASSGARAAPESSLDFRPFERDEIESSIGRRFERIVRRHPEREAVRTAEGSWTYARLNAAANRIARALAGPADRPVGLLLAPGGPLCAAMLAALKAGRFYTALDPALEPARLRRIFETLSPEVVVADEKRFDLALELAASGARILRVEEIAASGPASDPDVPASPDDLACVIFTSGSTGEPKGVVQNHRNVLHNVLKLTNGLRIRADDRITLLSSVAFGAALSDVYGSLLNGAALHPYALAGDGLRLLPGCVARDGITVFHSIPGVFRSFAAALTGAEDLSRLRMLKLGGEAVLASDFELYRRRFPKTCRFHVGLGATEMNVIRQWFGDHDTRWPDPPGSPLGYAVDGTEVVLLDASGRKSDGPGEIAIVARTLPVGYWNDPARSAEAFPPAPGREGLRIYRTGDLGRISPDGCLFHLGRTDSRVKVRGHRVEIPEVERELASLPGIREAAVVAREGPGGTRLVAYLAASPDRAQAGAIRRALAERVTGPMIPAAFVFLDSLPRTATGKVDRGALPDAGRGRPRLETEYVSPRDERERLAAEVFADVLELDRVGADDDFFDLGGSSLLATELLLRLSDRLGAPFSAADLVEASTPATLVTRTAAGSASTGGLVTLQRGESRRPVFLVSGGTGEGENLFLGARLARRVGPSFPFFGFRSLPSPLPPVEALAAAHVRQMRALQPRGPYSLVGECVGGLLALAMARRLRDEGESVALVALLDTPFPTIGRRLHAWVLRRAPWAGNVTERLRYFAGRIRHHAGALRALSRGRLDYLSRKLRRATRGLVSSAGEHRLPASRRRASYVSLLLGSRPPRFDGRIGLVESDEGHADGFGKAWSRVAPNIEIVRTSGDHYTYVVDEVDRVAEILRRWLEEAETKPPARAR